MGGPVYSTGTNMGDTVAEGYLSVARARCVALPFRCPLSPCRRDMDPLCTSGSASLAGVVACASSSR